MHPGTRGLTATERLTLRAAPALGVAAVVASALGFTESEARWALIYAGPTDQPASLTPDARSAASSVAWRIVVKSGSPAQARGSATVGQLNLWSGSHRKLHIPFQTDPDGVAWVAIERTAFQTGPIKAQITEKGRELANGAVDVPFTRWIAGKRVDGGWCTGIHTGPVEIRLGIIDGVLLHGYASAALVSLRANGTALANQPIHLEADGARFTGSANTSAVMLVSDARGTARFELQPTDMAAALTLTVPGPQASRFTASLPVRTGGLRAFRDRARVIVSTSVPTPRAWLGLLTQRGLVRVQSVELTERLGRWTGEASFADWPKTPLWGVVSAEPELESMNTLGWPLLDATERDQANPALVIPSVLALDGKSQVLRRLHEQRRRAWVTSSIALLFVAALVSWVTVRANQRHQRQVRRLAQLFESTQPPSLADRTPLALIAVLVMTAALVAMAFWVAL